MSLWSSTTQTKTNYVDVNMMENMSKTKPLYTHIFVHMHVKTLFMCLEAHIYFVFCAKHIKLNSFHLNGLHNGP